ncbi:ATP-binding protein [Undibacterium luofuense]|uniref:histidine kinase n=1 Tax=Undibacterium luofuense TaxID=2828733 RepID=A0A941I552_9BURK|nr:ATP-binding protein [Undibacterium luofuense]MBR7781226.1 PAS domain S-box protein [Undibacterium luofuense]
MTPKQDNGAVSHKLSLLLLGVGMAFAIIVQTYWSLTDDRKQTIEAEKSNGHVAIRILEEHVTQTLEDGARKLDAVAEQIADVSSDENRIQRLLRLNALQDSRFMKSLQFIHPNGESWVESPDFPAHSVNVADRDDIQFLLLNPGYTRIVFGHPYQSPYDSQLVVPLSRYVYDAEGRQTGILSANIRLSYFGDLYNGIAVENNVMLALIADAGFIIIRSPFEARYAGRDIAAEDATTRLAAMGNEGEIEDDSWLDDEFRRLYVFRKIKNYPVTVVYGRDFESMLAGWEKRVQHKLMYTALVLAALMVMMGLLSRQLSKLRRSELVLRQAEYKFSEIFERSPLALSLVDLQHRQIETVNQAWVDLFGYSKSVLKDQQADWQVRFWKHPEQLTQFVWQLAEDQQIDQFQAELVRSDGAVRTCLLSARKIFVGDETRYIVTPLDVTRELAAEQKLLELNAELEERVAKRTRNLEQSNAELAQALQSVRMMQEEVIRQEKLASLGALVAGIAHELNTPIGNSVTVTSTLQDEIRRFRREMESGQLKRSMLNQLLDNLSFGADVLMRSLGRASELIRSFKHVAVDQSSDMRRQFDLKETLQEILLTNSSMYLKTPYKLETQLAEGISMNSYPGALGQIISNFIANAIRHGFEGRAKGLMRLSTTLNAENSVEIRFSDDGHGIAADHLSKVFDPFFTTKFGQGGSGLGMNIVYNLVTEILGGRIHLESEPDKGTTFTLILPLHAPDSQH